MAAVHKLDALAELALLKALGIRNGEMRFGDGKAVDSVDAVDSREGIVFYLEFELLLFLGHDEACQIKVEFGEHDAYGLQSALHQHAVGTAVVDDYFQMLMHSAAKLPHLLQELILVLRFHIKQLFVAYKLAHTLLLSFGDTAVNQLIKNRIQLIFGERPALQQYLERGENLLVGQQIA